jgi:hypothetical protein
MTDIIDIITDAGTLGPIPLRYDPRHDATRDITVALRQPGNVTVPVSLFGPNANDAIAILRQAAFEPTPARPYQVTSHWRAPQEPQYALYFETSEIAGDAEYTLYFADTLQGPTQINWR